MIVVPPFIRPSTTHQPIVVAIDGLTPASSVLKMGFDEAALRSLPLLVLHAGQGTDTPADLEDRRRNIEEILAGWRADRPDVNVKIDIVRGDPAASICTHASHAPLLLVSRAHQRQFRSWTHSVANAVLDYCPCPLVVVPETGLPPGSWTRGGFHAAAEA